LIEAGYDTIAALASTLADRVNDLGLREPEALAVLG